jgi:hypothetical protein
VSGDEFAGEFGGEAVGEVLEHDEANEDGVAGGPWSGSVAEDTEFQRKIGALDSDGGVDTACVELNVVKLLGGESGDGAVSCGAKLKSALNAVVLKEASAGDLSELACSVTAEEIHLEESVLSSDEALSDDEVVEGRGADVGDAVGIALDGDGSREAGDCKCAVDLRQLGDESVVNVAAKGEESGDAEDEEDRAGDGDELQETAWATGRLTVAASRLPGEEGRFRWLGETHR